MRSFFRSAVLAAVTLVAAAALPSTAEARWFRPYYGGYYYPPVAYYAPPAYYYGPSYYYPGYLWSGRYYVSPFGSGVYYGRYYPAYNQYYYRYWYNPWLY